MKIVHFVLGKANPNRMNGVNKVVNNLATYQTNLGYDVDVWGITRTPDDVSDLPPRNYQTKLFKSINKLFIHSKIQESLRKLRNDTVFHIHGGFIPEFFNLSKSLVKEDIPYVVTPHGCYNSKAMEKNQQFKNIYFNMFEKNYLRNAKVLHCIGQSELDSSNRLVPNVDKVLIPNGQNLDELKYEYEEILEDRLDMPIFGYCGRMDEKMKGLDLLLEGFAIYRHQMRKDGKLWLIGGNQDFESLQNYARELGIAKDVTFWGPQFGNAKLNIIANMDAFYHASRYEGMPTAILEAAALKVPCVVSEATNLSDYVEEYDAGYVLDPNCADEVAWSMVHTLTQMKDKKWKEKGINAHNMVKTAFCWESIAQELVEVYSRR